ncbi:MAG: hypothetical protein EXS08_01285 [Planctomycetes bacterium]|nr:hypothetical protein [Planctomycetota bacterium]
MTRRWIAVAFLASVAVPLLEGVLPALELARGSLAALALLPWLALASAPRSAAEPGRWRATLYVALCALPPLALGAGLDLARGADGRPLAVACCTGWVLLCLWTAAAECAAKSARARGGFAVAWLVLVPGAAALRVALAWVPLREGAPSVGGRLLFALDPLVWCHRWARADGRSALAPGEFALALGCAAMVLLVVLLRAPSASGGAP